MAFQTTSMSSALVNKPRIQPEGLLKGSVNKSIRLGVLECYTSGRTNRAGGTKLDFTSTGANENSEWIAIRFRAGGDGSVDKILAPLGKTGSPAGTASISVFSEVDGLPDAIVASSGASGNVTINSGVTTLGGYVGFTWTTNKPLLCRNAYYWAVIKTNGYTYSNGVTELWLDTDTGGSSEVAQYDANGVPTWTTAGATVGSNLIVCFGNFEADETIQDSQWDFNKYALFATAFSPIQGRDISITVNGVSANSGRSNRARTVKKDFTSTGANNDGEWWGIRFTAKVSGTITSVKAPVGRTGSPAGTSEVGIYSIVSDLPDTQSGSDSDSVTNATGLTTTGTDVEYTWASGNPTVVKDVDYFVVIKTTGYTYSDGVTEVWLGTDTNGTSEVTKYDANGSPTWTTAGATIGACIKVGGIALTGTATLSALASLDTAKLIAIAGADDNGWGSVTSVTITDGTPDGYETIYLWAIPECDTVNYERLVFFRSADISGGASQMPVADRFDPVYTSILIRRGNTVTISKDYTLYTDMGKYAGRMITAIIELHPAGGGGVAEYLILANVYIAVPMNQPDNAMITLTMDGGYSQLLVYTP